MAEAGIQLRRARESAIVQLNEHLSKAQRADRLKDSALCTRFGRFGAGWKLEIQVEKESFELVILVGDAFPFEPPELRFADPSAFLRFPHVDGEGKLCLTNAAATFSPNLVTQTVDFLLGEARKLISDSVAGRNDEDFIQEFQMYWRCLPAFSRSKFWSLLKPASPTRRVVSYATNGLALFGESEDDIRVWLKNYNGGSLPKGFNTKPSVLVWLKEPIQPKRHPKTAHDVLTLARESAHTADDLLLAAIPREAGSLPMILGFASKTGPILVGVELPEPQTANRSNPRKQQNSRNFGFRPGHVPEDVLRARYFGTGKLALTEVTRVDSAWCLERGGSGYDSDLFRKRIAIVGCGSLGADVAVMLAKSGVGRFLLIDNDALNWGNVARHVLGGDSAGQAKASALAKQLLRQMPWLEISEEFRLVERLIYESPKVLQECELIISTTGDWTCDCLLNAASRTFARFPSIVFGWTEPYGIAGHALAAMQPGGCLACGMNEFGVFDSRVTAWEEGRQPILQAAGCNDLYQPYGVTDVAQTKAMIAELALDILRIRVQESTLRTWIGDTTRLKLHGGKLHDKWSEKITPGTTDRRTMFQPWSINPKCQLCN